MGIPGIYQEIGPGDRISLSKLAVQTLEETGRPLRLAIDISIWQFQALAARGGSNPAIRTLFYRLVRLQSHSIQPIFVFDGPNKPAMKRGRRTDGGRSGGNVVSTAMAKRLIRLVACQAARAGFGRSLCRIKRSDPPDVLTAWREGLRRELADNTSGSFSRRNKIIAAAMPDDFPDMEVLGYYTHPIVSRDAVLERLKSSFPGAAAGGDMDLQGLRDFAAHTFDWTGKGGATKFIRVLAPSLLVQKLLLPSSPQDCLVKAISKRRVDHPSSGRIPELRVSFLPLSVVDIDLDAEPEEAPEAHGRGGLALNSDDEFEEADVPGSTQGGGAKKGFDPSQPDMVWIPEAVVRLGAPEVLRNWEAGLGAKRAAASAPKKKAVASAPKATRTRRAKAALEPSHTMDRYLRATKKAFAHAESASTKPESLLNVLGGLSNQGSPNLESGAPPTRRARSRIDSQLKESGECVSDCSSGSSKQTRTNEKGTLKDATRSAREPSLPPASESAMAARSTADRAAASSVIVSSVGTRLAASKDTSNISSISNITDTTSSVSHAPVTPGRADAADGSSCSPPVCHQSPPPPRWKPVTLLSSSPPSSPASPPSLPPTSISSSLRSHPGFPLPEKSFDDPNLCTLSSLPPGTLNSSRKRMSSGSASSETSPATGMERLNISSSPDSPSTARRGRAAQARSGGGGGKRKQASILGFVNHGSGKQQAPAQRRAPTRREKSTSVSPPRRTTGSGDEELARPAASPPRFRRPPSIISLSSDDESEPEQKPTAEAVEQVVEPTTMQGPACHGKRAQVVESTGGPAATAVEDSDESGHNSEYSDEDTWATAESRLPPPSDTAEPGRGRVMTKPYRSRKSAVGYMAEVEVSREEADRMMRENETLAPGRRHQLYRRSDVFVIDLTDEP
ncbi:hypothetical protein MAPG_08563 [Magnaporthiopsis poae ATCC 64411]|uniref:XPG N-terminal domain-containing protein n=1 Tax=Magnaporthiopsis poae (strain ATCC 64411 / 73-15) TaxID=644358 RepID=A0A0C4E7P5_MAGP6|nr:hypothetical protein MAPG_08563 [Magnaporthiopsis poae ATCC 64411]